MAYRSTHRPSTDLYHISMVDGILSTGVANAPVTCSALELITVQPANGATCGNYLQAYADSVSSLP